MNGKHNITTPSHAIFVLSTMLYSVCEAVGIDDDTSMKMKAKTGEGVFEITVAEAIERGSEIMKEIGEEQP